MNQTFSDLTSVVYPVYDAFDRERLELSVKSALQQSTNVEVIISEYNDKKRFDLDIGGPIKHVFREKSSSSSVRPGEVRNQGVLKARGAHVYTNDADIILQDEDFFEMLDLLPTPTPMTRPPLKRLHQDETSSLYDAAEKQGLKATLAGLHESELSVSLNSARTLLKRGNEISPLGYKRSFTVWPEDFERYQAHLTHEEAPRIFMEDRHCGGNYFTKAQFQGVGGYHEGYKNWGYEDTDFQRKLQREYGISLIPDHDAFSVIHLDHPKGYFDEDAWQRNKDLFTQREATSLERIKFKDQERLHEHLL